LKTLASKLKYKKGVTFTAAEAREEAKNREQVFYKEKIETFG